MPLLNKTMSTSASTVTFLANPPPTKARVVLIGNSGVGKTSLVKRILDHDFKPSLTQTVGVDFRILRVTTTDTRCPVKLEIWDTAGEERFLAVTSLYFRHAPLMLLCYDRTEFRTLTDLRTYWLPEISREVDLSNVVILLVATKYDISIPPSEEEAIREELEDHWIGSCGYRRESDEHGRFERDTRNFVGHIWSKFTRPAALHHVITSAKDGANVKEVFQLGADCLEANALLKVERPPQCKPNSVPCCIII